MKRCKTCGRPMTDKDETARMRAQADVERKARAVAVAMLRAQHMRELDRLTEIVLSEKRLDSLYDMRDDLNVGHLSPEVLDKVRNG